ncbi:citryl-CoA lyase [Methanobacterium paludis]|uniref:Citrate synthase n=1 Tax=Methanobacterium paludis (strain DSM 25820 / JCM 18151 / SWAN1) TaxID=868131 RepID=F6D6T6_METPW|nr:citryl-CoA lyase [Methanobacterium paludis]AEG18974.1 Citrate synthase [Methanobacterium paludis]
MATERKTVEEMLKLSAPKWRTAITKIEPNKIITRGYSQEDLIGNISFPEMVYLLLKGDIPSENESKMLESVLVSFCDHGITPPSTQVARLMASTGSPMNSCVSGGILSFGKYHAGALESSMRVLQEVVQKGVGGHTGPLKSHHDINAVTEILVEEFLENGEKVPGFGHRYHTEDPRARKLIKLAKKYGCSGIHTEFARAIEDRLYEMKGIRMNVDGANSGILSDMGFDWKLGTGIFMIGRLPAIVSHVYEEKTSESPFRKLFEVDEIHYNGVEEGKIDILKKLANKE